MTKRFKGLNLTERVPERLLTGVCKILQEVVIKTIPNKMKCKKAKWFSEKTYQIVEKRREVKDKGEKETYPFECRVPNNSKER